MSAVVVEELTKRYGSFTAVEDVGFEVGPGETLALLGPNGAGKTTTLEILEGFVPPTSGLVRVLGADPLRAPRSWRARVGLVLQSTSLDPQLTVWEALRLFARLYPSPMPVADAVRLMGLDREAHVRIGALSGGQRRRVDVALGIIGRPEVLFLDEPTTGLDPEARRRTWVGVRALATEGTAVVLTTHYLEEAAELADRIVVLVAGRKVADATPLELRARQSGTTVRYRLPTDAPVADLSPDLGRHIDPALDELVVHTTDVTSTLDALIRWALRHDLELTGLEVGTPSLEDAYLALTTEPASVDVTNHA